MFIFRREQKTFEIGNIKVGGQPGENPPVLIGSIFYYGHKIVIDEEEGTFHKEDAEKLIKLQEEFSDKTNNPCMLDIVASTKEAIEKFIDFVAHVTEEPFLVDSPNVEVKIAGVKHARDVGLEKRVIYNSITLQSKREEFEVMKESRVKNAILLAYETGFMTSKARVRVIKELLPKAEEAGIERPMLDTFVIDVPSLSMACRAMLDLKEDLGLPCGCGAHNAISTWAGFKERVGVQAVKPCAVTVNVAPIILGADFILYGPIEDCKYLFPSVQAINISYKHLGKMKEQIEL